MKSKDDLIILVIVAFVGIGGIFAMTFTASEISQNIQKFNNYESNDKFGFAMSTTCIDSDGGQNFDVKGTTTYYGSQAVDFCNVTESFSAVMEFSCDADIRKLTQHECTCQDGACIATPVVAECTDSDGSDDHNIQGTTTITSGSTVVEQKIDECFNGATSVASCFGIDCTTTEYVCNSGSIINQGRSASYGGCVNGVYISHSCNDTDKGLNENIEGSTSEYDVYGAYGSLPITGQILTSTYSDSCENSNTVREYGCNNNRATSVLKTCATDKICQNGVCITNTYSDSDGDGYNSNVDCNDNNASVYSLMTCYANKDATTSDIYPSTLGAKTICGVSNTNYNITINSTKYICNYNGLFDCNDNNSAIHPGKLETCNGIDDNCNNKTDEEVLKRYYRDFDVDTYGNAGDNVTACTKPVGYVTNNYDCDDTTNTLTTLTACRLDTDNDAYPVSTNVNLCVVKTPNYKTTYNNLPRICSYAGYGAGIQYDCNNNDASINQGKTEICSNSINENCISGKCDADGDGYAATTIVASENTANLPATDCNDANSKINPSKTEITGNTVDENCNGSLTN